jgi:uncharacterized protein YgiM (DUF1202 family)
VLPWVLLVIVLWVTLGFYADYRGAVRTFRQGGSTESTSSAGTTGTAEETAQPNGSGGAAVPAVGTVTVLADGLNLRTLPSTSATVIKRLSANVKLELLGTREGWYQVRDADGYEGWVAAGGQYTRLDK